MRVSTKPKSPSIIFCGTHRVNFVMFEPVYQRLRRAEGLWMGVSTGMCKYRSILGWGVLAGCDPARLASETVKQ